MNKRLIKILIFLLTPLLIVVGFSSWIIVGEKSQIVAESPAEAVCYNSVTGTKYTRIEKALDDAVSGQTIYVYPGLKESDNKTSREIRIYKDCTIKKGVTLCLPYEGTTYYSETTWGTTQVYSDSTLENKNTYRQIFVVLSEGVTLTVDSGAKLAVGGIFGYQANPISGIVNGNYCELSLEKNAAIISYGSIDCYGIIKEHDYLNNGSRIEAIRGSINLPFAIYDFKGGTKSTELNSSNICPFDQFDFGNVQTLLRIHSGVTFGAEYRLYMSSTQFRGKVNVVSSSSTNTLFILTSGYMDIKYTAKTLGYTVIDQTVGQTIISLNGNMTIGSIQLTVKVIFNVTLDTANYYMPIPYNFKLNIEDGGTMIVSKKVKLLQGTVAHIKKGGTVQISSELYGLEKYDATGWESNGLNVTYPVNLDTARIINDGYLLIDSGAKLAINVESSSELAILDVSSSSNKISASLKGENYNISKDITLNGTLDGTSSASDLNANVYVSQSNYKWKAFTNVAYTLNYNKTYANNNDEFESSIPFTNHNEQTTSITLTGTNKSRTLTSNYNDDGEYRFFGWYYDEKCTEKIVDNIVNGSQLIPLADNNNIVNVYAKFTKAPLININYYGLVSTNGINKDALVDSTIRQTIAGETISLLPALNSYYITETSEMKFYKFNGWNIELTYLDGSTLEYYSDAGSKFTIPKDYNGTSVKITAADYVYDYSMYALIVTQEGGGLGYIESSSFSVAAFDGSTSIGSSAKTYYLMSDSVVTIKLRSGGGSKWGSGSDTTSCVLTGSVFTTNNNSSSISITSSGTGIWFDKYTDEHSFTINNAVTLHVKHSET